MEKQKRKMLAKARMEQQEKEHVGGVYAIENRENGKRKIIACPDLRVAQNRFLFSQQNGNCLFTPLRADWTLYGQEVFSFVVLEELEKGQDQEQGSYQKDLGVLAALWEEKFDSSQLY